MEEIRKLVKDKLAQSQKNVIAIAYRNMVKNHNGMYGKDQSICDCEFCKRNEEYVDHKISVKNHLKLLDSIDGSFTNDVLNHIFYRHGIASELANKKRNLEKIKSFPQLYS